MEDSLTYTMKTVNSDLENQQQEAPLLTASSSAIPLPQRWFDRKFHLMEPINRRFIRAILAEFIATTVLIIVCGGTAISQKPYSSFVGDASAALSTGTIAGALVFAVDPVSGAHFNPAVSFAMLLAKDISLIRTVIYTIVQLLGSLLGAALLLGITINTDSLDFSNSVPVLGMGIAWWQGILIECAITTVLVLVVCCIHVNPRQSQQRKTLAPISIFFTLTANIFFAGALTGATMNPARSFGPAVIDWFWTDIWVYFIGPYLGAIAGVFVYLVAIQDSFIS